MENRAGASKLETFLECCENQVENGFILAALTDSYLVGYWRTEQKEAGEIEDTDPKSEPKRAEGLPAGTAKDLNGCRRKELHRDMMKQTLLEQEDKVLEIRVFDKNWEGKLFRSDISKAFCIRIADEAYEKRFHDGWEKLFPHDASKLTDEWIADAANSSSYEEWQYLDIDESIAVGQDGYVTATGGGRYFLPLPNTKDARIGIRYYLGYYEETGQVRVEDWRLIGFRCG